MNCDRYVKKENLYKLTYKVIVKNNDIKNGPDTIPSIFKRLTNEMKDEMYFKFKKYNNWLQHEIDLCDECYLDHTKL